MAEMLKFRKGTHAKLLEQSKVAGTIYVTTDEKAMYVDIDNNTRIRLGQTVNFATLSEFQTFLNTTIPPYSTEAFYYIEDKNALLRWKSSSGTTAVGGLDTKGEWVQINSTQAVTNAITEVSDRVSTLENTVNNNDTGLVKKVSTLENTVNNSNTGLVKRVTTNETNIKNLQDAIGMGEGSATGSIGTTVSQLVADLDQAEKDIAALDNTVAGHTSTLNDHTEAIIANAEAIVKQAEDNAATYATIDNLNKEIQDRQKAINQEVSDRNDKVQEETDRAINEEGLLRSNIENLSKALSEHKTLAENNYAKKEDVYTKTDTYTKKQVDDAIDADVLVESNRAIKAEEAINGNIAILTETVEKLNSSESTEGSVKQQIKVAKEALSDEIDAEIRAANAMEFVDGVANSNALPATAKNGATYVAEGTFMLNSEQVLPGDLLIATGDEDVDTGLITTPVWRIVHTGYDATLEQTLKTVNGKIQLTSAVGDINKGAITFEAKSGTSATVSVANNTVTFGIEWDNF